MLRGLGGKAAGGSRCGLLDGLEQGTQVAVPYIWIQGAYGLVLRFARLFNP